MRYTNDESGLLNNFAVEPKMYQAEPPTNSEKRNYIVIAIGALILVSSLIFVAVSVSS